TFSAPDFASMIANLDLSDSLGSLFGSWDTAMTTLANLLRGKVFGVQIPLIGDKLKEGADFIDKLRTFVNDALQNAPNKAIDAVREALFDALGPSGLGWLKDTDNNGSITKDDVGLIQESGKVQFNVDLHQEATLINTPIGFDLGLPALGLSAD